MNHVSPSLAERRAYAVPRGIASTHGSIVVERALGATVWDSAGRAYLDFTAGIAVCNVGHCHPRVVEAAARQITTAIHTCFNVAPYESYIAVAERLNALAPGNFSKKTQFVSTGARRGGGGQSPCAAIRRSVNPLRPPRVALP
jgi:4-aminobutyrate aminotransferase-like enzyme